MRALLMFLLGACLAPAWVGSIPTAHAPHRADEAEASARQERLRWAAERRSVCGIYALYLWLDLQGRDVELGAVEEELELSPIGHDMLALAQGAERFGARAEVRRYRSLDELRDSSFPMIALATRSILREGVRVRHFLVALECRDGLVRYLDATTGSLGVSKEEVFFEATTGYYVAAPGRPFAAGLQLVAGGLLGFLGVGFLMRARRTRRVLRPAIALGAALLLFSGTASAQTWRLPENDARNALTMLLRAHGEATPYEVVAQAVEAGGPEVSLLALRDIGRDLGVELDLVTTEPFDAMRAFLPAVVHIRHPRRDEGGFVVLFGVTESGVSVLEAGTCRFGQMNWENFLRDWSGHLLIHPDASPAGDAGGGMRWNVFFPLGVALCYLALRWR